MAAPSSPTAPTAGSSDTSTSPWASSLPDDLARLLASRLLDDADDAGLLHYIRFRAVCAAWRRSTASPHGRGVVDPRFHPRRWMLFPEGHGFYPGHPELHGYARFFNLDTGAFVRVHVPLFEEHCVLDSVDGLLVLQRDADTAVRLLHPFTGDVVDLPPLSTLLPQMRQYQCPSRERPARRKILYLRSVTTAATFTDDGVVAVMLAFTKRMQRVAFATSLDHRWTMSTWSYYPICSSPAPFSYHGKMYLVNVDTMVHTYSTVKIFQIDTPLPGESLVQPPKLISTCDDDTLWSPVCMVECDSEVLVIGYTDTVCSKLLVYRLEDLVVGRCIPVTCIGDKAIFLAKRTLSASAKALPTLEAGTITSRNPMRGLMKFHLGSGSWSPAMDPCSLHGMEAGPCSFVQHMVTCCSCTHWNKGLLYRGKTCFDHPVNWLRWPVKGKLRHGA